MRVGNEHYFTNDPKSEFRPKTIRVELAGRPFQVQTAGGIFSPDHLDRGTEVLLNQVDAPPNAGVLLDLGCGWGAIALSMALQSPAAEVWAVDVNERALELTRQNAASLGLRNVQTATPEAVPDGLQLSEIWSNPPIRVGKAVLHEMLSHWLPRLEPGGKAHLVVAKKLGADSLLTWINETLGRFGAAERTANDAGFRVLTFTRS